MKELRIEQSFTNLETRSVDRYLTEVNRIGLVSVAEETRLAELVQQGDGAALERLVTANLRFVISVAKKYQGQGVPLADLINEGNLGLIAAAKKFDYTKGFRFITYAVYWIRNHMFLAVSEQNKVIRVPINEVQLHTDLRRASNELQSKLHREPTADELAEYLELSEQRVLDTISYNPQFVSADQPGAADTFTPLIEMIPSGEPSPDAPLLKPMLQHNIKDYVQGLPERDRAIIEYSFGLNGRTALCNRDMAAAIGLGSERIRQLRVALLGNIREKFLKVYEYEDCML